MRITKKRLIFLVSALLVFAMAGCIKDIETPGNGPTLDEEKNPIDHEVFHDAYDAYFVLLTEKSAEIIPTNDGFFDGKVAILDVFDDEKPELLYIYWHDYEQEKGFVYPVLSLKIFTHSKSEGVDLVFDSIVEIAAGGPNEYCVYLTHEGELMLYRSGTGLPNGWGFWQIIPNLCLERTDDSWGNYWGNYDSDLAKLYFSRFDNKGVPGYIYKKDGDEINKEQHDETVKEIMGNIDRVIFQGFALYEQDDLWKDIPPFKTYSMTYDEAIAWLDVRRTIAE